jgi:L-asparagine transporter-like permease
MGQPQGFDYKELIYRVGTFFLLVGIGLVVLFMLSEAAQQATFSYFCLGTVLLIIGFMFRAQYKKSLPPSGRFSLIKRLMPKSKEDKGKK